MRAPVQWARYFLIDDVYDEDMGYFFKELIRRLLGSHCFICGRYGYKKHSLDIHHINHDGGSFRKVFGGYTSLYYFDILWGVMHDCDEVILLCRPCHTKHHKENGYE